MKCTVAGAGVFGAWTAYLLQRAGHQVTLLDPYGPAHSRASSGGESRIIRAAYGPDEIYSRMAVRSMQLWAEFFACTGRSLFHRTGVLWLGKPENSYVRESREVLRRIGWACADLDADELRRLYPQMRFDPDTIGLLEPDAGALMARQAVQAVVQQFVAEGGLYRQELMSLPAGDADTVVFACGPWLGKVFPELLGNRIFPTRQEVLFFGTQAGDDRFRAPRLPVWLDFSNDLGMYGFPDLEGRGFKLACDRHGEPFDPDRGSRVISEESVAAARDYLRDRFPRLADAPVVETRVCQYENTSNGDFLIDRHPDFPKVWIAGGGSGHGFKHGPAVGEYVAARVAGAAEPPVEPRFSLETKGTVQKREVR